MTKPLVSIVMGSDSDLEIMREAGKLSMNSALRMRWT
jgi:phosphoribosylcarboxyaminoimidazole (NCAIR) mutase